MKGWHGMSLKFLGSCGPPSPHSWQPQAQWWLEHHLASLPLLLLVESSLLQAESSQLQLFPTQVPPESKRAKNINKSFKTSQNRSKATRIYHNLSDIIRMGGDGIGWDMLGMNVPGCPWNILGRLHLTFGNCRRSVCLSIHWHRCRFWCRLSLPCSRSCLFICNFCRRRFHLQAKRQHMATHINKSFNIFENVHNLLDVIRVGGDGICWESFGIVWICWHQCSCFFWAAFSWFLEPSGAAGAVFWAATFVNAGSACKQDGNKSFKTCQNLSMIFKGYQNLSEIIN